MRVLLCAFSLRGLDAATSHLEATASQLLRWGAEVHVATIHRSHARDADPKKSYLVPLLLARRGCRILLPSRAPDRMAAGEYDFCVGYSRRAADMVGEILPDVPKFFVHLDPRAARKAVTYRRTMHLGATEEVCAALLKARAMKPDRIKLVRIPIDFRRFRNTAPPKDSIRRILVVAVKPRMAAVVAFAKNTGAGVTVVGRDCGEVTARCFNIHSPWRVSKKGVIRNRRCEYNIEKLMHASDLVIATGRTAYEAMACGRPVLIHTPGGVGECLITDEGAFSQLIKNNCSGRTLERKFAADEMAEELEAYDPSSASSLRGWVKSRFDAVDIVREMTDLAMEVRNE